MFLKDLFNFFLLTNQIKFDVNQIYRWCDGLSYIMKNFLKK